MFGSLGAPELLIILAIVVVLFGATRIGDIGKGIGRGIKEFRRELKDVDEDKPGDEAKVVSSTAESSKEETTTPSQTH
jgi:sec-independent protein translocase protein TatA